MPDETICIACQKPIEGRRYRFSTNRPERVCESCRKAFAPLFSELVDSLKNTPDTILKPYQEIRSLAAEKGSTYSFVAYLLECGAENAGADAQEIRERLDREVKERSAVLEEEARKEWEAAHRKELEEKLKSGTSRIGAWGNNAETNRLFEAYQRLLLHALSDVEEALDRGDAETAKQLLGRLREDLE